MTHFARALLVTAAAGIGGTGLGGLTACLFRRESRKTTGVLLSFAAGVMLSVVCFDLLEDALSPAGGGLGLAMSGVLLGYGATAALNRLLGRWQSAPAHGELFLAGLVMAAAIALHNVPEGMVIGAAFARAAFRPSSSGMVMAAVIGLHNVPEGMAVAAPLISGGVSKPKAAAITAITGAPTAAGAALGFALGTMGPRMLAISLSFASGAMLYVVFGELLPESVRMWRSKLPALAAVAGVLVGMMITQR